MRRKKLMKKHTTGWMVVTLALVAGMLAGTTAQAASGTWDTDSAGDWTDITKWQGDAAYASGADSTATLGNFITAARIINLNAPITIGNITASDTSHGYTISGANILTLDRTDATAPTIDVTQSGITLTISSQISGSDGLQKISAGTLVLGRDNTTANTYSGTTTLSAGTLQGNTGASVSLTPGNPFGISALQLNGGTLQLRSSGTANGQPDTIQWNNNTTVGGDVTINVTRAGGSGSNKIHLLGTLSIGAFTLTASDVSSENHDLKFGNTTLTGNATFNVVNASGAMNLTLGAVGDGGSGFSLTKSGAGTLTLSGNNSFSGGLTVSAGNLFLSGTQSFTGGVTLNGGSMGTNASGTGIPVASLNGNSITANTGASFFFMVNGETLATSSTVTINSTLDMSIANGGTGIVPGVVSGAGTLILGGNNLNAGTTLRLTNPNNTFSGNVSFPYNNGGSGNGPTLSVASIGDAGKITVGQNTGDLRQFALDSSAVAPLTFNTRQFELVGAAGVASPTIANNSVQAFNINTDLLVTGALGTRTLALRGTGTGLSTFAGNITKGSLTTLGITKTESGTWILSGANSYNGGTSVTAGKLVGVVGGSCENSAVTVSAGTFGISVTDNTKQWTCKSLRHTLASTLEFAFGGITPSTTVAPLQVNGDVVFNVAPAVSCTGSSLPAGTYPLMTWTGVFSGLAPSAITLTSGTGILVIDNANKTLWLKISGAGENIQPLTWKGPASSTWVANEGGTTKWQDPTPTGTDYRETTVSGITVGDRVVFGTTGAGIVTLNTTVSPAAVSVNPATPNNYTISGSGSIAGVGSLAKSGTCTLTLNTANTYAGGTVVSAGTLVVGNADALGTGTISLSGGCTLQSSDATARTFANAVVLGGGLHHRWHG